MLADSARDVDQARRRGGLVKRIARRHGTTFGDTNTEQGPEVVPTSTPRGVGVRPAGSLR